MDLKRHILNPIKYEIKQFKELKFRKLNEITIEVLSREGGGATKIEGVDSKTDSRVYSKEVLYQTDKVDNKEIKDKIYHKELDKTDKNINNPSDNLLDIIYNGKILSITNMGTEWKEVYKIKLNKTIDFIPGDSVGLYCYNPEHVIKVLLSYLNYNQEASSYNDIYNTFYKIERKGCYSYEYSGNLYGFLRKIDVLSLPKKSFLNSLSEERDKNNMVEVVRDMSSGLEGVNNISTTDRVNDLKYLCSKEGVKDYYNIYKNFNNLLDILEYFKCKITLELLAEHCEFIKPRYFSLINNKSGNIELLIGIMSHSVSNSVRYGQVSAFIKEKYNEKYMNIDINKDENKDRDREESEYSNSKYGCCNDINYNDSNTKPILDNIDFVYRMNRLLRLQETKKHLLISTGTGIAPFISFYKNRRKDYLMWLIYGCRNVCDDLSKDMFDRKNVVYSADYEYTGNYKYVSDYILGNVEGIKEFILSDCSVYVCGSIQMQKSVLGIFKEYFSFIIEEKRMFFDSWN
ncbi:hypothetical protein CWI37_0578p0020 [Hamiltosporidium tvaerminnensis]|uniref:Oxidoreductase FAD/NAD(P)-binding domain-containing protein n=2 Tax=Hamiltosporidium tvaerminnensis TaxID=1176355 RepID=A0A4Q9L484_9MICR|nr:hypothetical protein CWI37_0578p0020 [Hamiltosporidium tvaerminnensis]